MDKRLKTISNTVAVKLFIMIVKGLGCIAFSVVLTVSYAGCKERKQNLQWEEALIHVNITKLKTINNKSTYVYADLEVTGQGKILKKANLNCIQIRITNQDSKKLYVDSVAHILTDGYHAKDNKIHVKIYWLFDVNIEENYIDKFEIFVRPNQGEKCFEYQQ
jgi:hypothetical protein